MSNRAKIWMIWWWLGAASMLAAQSPEQSPFDDLLEGLPRESSSPTEELPVLNGSPLSTAYDAMRRAQQQLESGDQVKSVVDAQQAAIDALDSLLEQLKQPPPPPSEPPSPDPSSQPAAEPSSPPSQDGQAAQPQPEPRGGEAPSEEQLEGTADTDPTRLQRQLQQSVWGHLPDRVRQQLQAAMPDEFHPRYQRAITEYFRQLTKSETTR